MAKGNQVVVFRVGREMFGIPIETIREIVRMPDITEVPDSPEFFEGVMNLRGRVVPVIDLGKRLRLNGKERTKSTRVLIAERTDSTVGLVVDSVTEVFRVQPDSIEEPPDMISAMGIEYITGVAKADEKLIIFLDLERVLNLEDIREMNKNVESLAEPQTV